jgi:apolipoprotein N-acyltransferase
VGLVLALALSALCGLVLSLANPPVGAGPIAFVALIPFLWVARRSRSWTRLLAGFVFGFCYFAATVYWIRLFGGLAWGSLSLASAAYPALFALLVPVLWRENHPVRSSVGVAALWTAIEYFRGMWPLGGFTWGGLGYTQADNGFLLPLASVAGVWGVSFVVMLVNSLLLVAVQRLRSAGARPRWGAIALAGSSAAVILLPGLIPIAQPNGRAVDVAVVQGNHFSGGGGLLGRSYASALAITRSQAALHRALRADPPDLVVWPEDAVDFDPARYQPFRRLVHGAVRAVGSPTLVGAITGPPDGVQYNEGLLYDGSVRIVGRYQKIHLVPFGEYVPWRRYLGFISAIRQIPYDLSAGHRVHTLAVDGLRFGDPICFENSFPSLDRRMVAQGAGFLVVSTNNASYERTAASRQHLIMSRFRAVENGRWVVHAAISGISAFIDPDGGVHDQTGLFTLTTIRRTIHASSARTVYNRFGDWLPWVSFAFAVVLMLLPRARKARDQSVEPLPDLAKALVILPTYDERRTIGEVISRVRATRPDVDVLVVDDGSPDGTGEAVREIAASEPRVRLMSRSKKEGLAPAYLAGFRWALDRGYDLVVEMDADLSHQPEELPHLLEGADRFDLTIGSRYIPGGSVTNWGKVRLALSRAGNRYARLALGLPVSDATSGYRVYRRGLLSHLLAGGVHSDGYGFQVELAYRSWRDGYVVGEVPITFREREHGHSKISRRIVFEALAEVTWWGLCDRLRVGPPPGEAPSRRREIPRDVSPDGGLPSPVPDAPPADDAPTAPTRSP